MNAVLKAAVESRVLADIEADRQRKKHAVELRELTTLPVDFPDDDEEDAEDHRVSETRSEQISKLNLFAATGRKRLKKA